jgi:hypothetical protein
MPTQRHIHLSETLSLGPEFSPYIKWRANKLSINPRVTASLKYSISGSLKAHVLRDSSGPIVYQDYMYTLIISNYDGFTAQERVDFLLGMYGKIVYFVEHTHPNDGEDHTDFVKAMYLKPKEYPEFVKTLQEHRIDIELVDATR